MGIADAELGSVAVELFDFVLKLCEDFCDACLLYTSDAADEL